MALYTYPDLPPADEPTLEEMLADPMIQLIMQRDGVSQVDMKNTLGLLQSKYADFSVMQ